MEPAPILAPVFALAALTFAALVLIPIVRFKAAFAGKVVRDDFLLGESARVPPDVAKPNRNYMNLLEAPILFYLVCLICLATAPDNRMMVSLAWIYVGLRLVHSIIHVTYNNVFHRLAAFGASNLVLLGMWTYLFARVYVSRGA